LQVVVLAKKIDDFILIFVPLSFRLSLSLSQTFIILSTKKNDYVSMTRTRILLLLSFHISGVVGRVRLSIVSVVSFLLSFAVVCLLLRGRLLRRRGGNGRKLLRVPVEKSKPRVVSETVPSSVIWNIRFR
jgi:hypothetical protein